jgi:hypothetical protein
VRKRGKGGDFLFSSGNPINLFSVNKRYGRTLIIKRKESA